MSLSEAMCDLLSCLAEVDPEWEAVTLHPARSVHCVPEQTVPAICPQSIHFTEYPELHYTTLHYTCLRDMVEIGVLRDSYSPEAIYNWYPKGK